MTVRFGNYRMFAYVFIFLLVGTVLGLTANFAKIFLPEIHHDFIIMTLVVAGLTIFTFIFLFQWSQPQIEVIILFILGVLWLSVAAFSTDTIGHIECYPLFGNQTAAANGGTTSYREYCYEMKVIEGFSWAIFILFALFFIIVIALTNRAVGFGNHHAWEEPIQHLPWFGEMPDYYRQAYGGGYGGQPGFPGQQYMYPPGAIQQQPGHSLIIQPGRHGQPTTVQQVPTAPSNVMGM